MRSRISGGLIADTPLTPEAPARQALSSFAGWLAATFSNLGRADAGCTGQAGKWRWSRVAGHPLVSPISRLACHPERREGSAVAFRPFCSGDSPAIQEWDTILHSHLRLSLETRKHLHFKNRWKSQVLPFVRFTF